ncbi:toxin-antitoxin system, toxin component [Streptomyces mirabilis]|uniref:toxin-antitoxin system, toxin component n=1 Tax=Streptomyces mirabilis TaxID=68239 RepID=UPI000C714E09|nr:toxin-antitoxin system, toxin component [Streptomyces mirabilis]
MRKFLADITDAVAQRVDVPANPRELFEAMCAAVGELQGKEVTLRLAAFPKGTGSGLLLDFGDKSLVVIEERTSPEHQLVILGHELWHEKAGHCSHDAGGAAMAARLLSSGDRDWEALAPQLLAVAARTEFDENDENEAEKFGLKIAGKFRSWMSGDHARGPLRTDTVQSRMSASLEYRGQ